MRGGDAGEEPRGKSRRMYFVCSKLITHLLVTFQIRMSRIQVAKKLNILCLHGYFQDAAIMKDRTPSLFRKLKSIANFCKHNDLN